MDSISLDVPLHIHFEAPMHLGTGRAEVLIDRTVRRNAEGDPYVPGSALKGALRMTAERLVGQLNEIGGLGEEMYIGKRRRGQTVLDERCRAPRAEEMCQSRDPCIVCRLFGNVFTGSRLHVSGAQATGDSPLQKSLEALATGTGGETAREHGEMSPATRASLTDVLTRLRIDRRRQGAEKGRLFTSEYSRPATAYEAILSGTVPHTPLSNAMGLPAELVLLAASIAATDQIGGESTTGHGTCRLQPHTTDLISVGELPPDVDPLERADSPPYPLDALLDDRPLQALAWYRFDN